MADIGEPNPEEFYVTYLGQIIDGAGTREGAEKIAADLLRKIRADEVPGFLGPDDIEPGARSADVFKVRSDREIL